MQFPFTAKEYELIAINNTDRDFWMTVTLGLNPVLEIGCGSGRIARWLYQEHDYYCLDTAVDMIEKVRSDLGLDESHAMVGKLEEHNWDNHFQIILASANVVCHMSEDDLDDFLCAAHQALKRHGTIVIDTFNPDFDKLNNPPEKPYEFKRFVDPEDGKLVVVIAKETFDRSCRAQILDLRYTKDGVLTRERQLIQYMHQNQDIVELAEKNSFSVMAEYGDYQFSPYSDQSRKQIILLRK